MAIGTVHLPRFGDVALAASDDGICALAFLNHADHLSREPQAGGQRHLARGLRQLADYAAGKRTDFDLPLDLSACTPFTRAVLLACARIPFGKVVSYGELAKIVGKPGAARAVGQALGRNPLAIVVPCHRVVGGSGDGGFTAGMPLKYLLWQVEGIPRRSAPSALRPSTRTD